MGEPPKKLTRIHAKERKWSTRKPSNFGSAVPDFQLQPLKDLPESCDHPYDFFCLFISDEFVDMLVNNSRLYAVRKNRPEIISKITSNNLRLTHAIMYMTGYITPSNGRMFWEEREDTRNLLVKKYMSGKIFTMLISNTYFVETATPDPADRFWKVRPLFVHLNQSAKKWVRQPERVSVDEGMVKYFGPHPLKQYMKGKPHRFGYKIWVLASAEGELLACQPYAGASTHIPDYGLGQGPNVVLGLAEQFELSPGTKVYVDNLFTSLDLLDHMGSRQLGITGTLRQNRLNSVPLPTKKEAVNKMQRGELQTAYSGNVAVLVWKDNQPVYMASNTDDVLPMGTCQRYSKREKKYIAVPQPNINQRYNKSMGGVDLLDNAEKNYAITTR